MLFRMVKSPKPYCECKTVCEGRFCRLKTSTKVQNERTVCHCFTELPFASAWCCTSEDGHLLPTFKVSMITQLGNIS